MPFIFFNPNPKSQRVGDCSVRACCKAVGKDWDETFTGLCSLAFTFKDMPSSNYVWGVYLQKYGFQEHMISSICPACTTVEQFAKDHRRGRYVLATQNHVVAVDNGDYFDTWDSGNEIVLYFYKKEI